MAEKNHCKCGCGTDVTRSTELRHLQGKTPVRLQAAKLSKKASRAARQVAKPVKKIVKAARKVVKRVQRLFSSSPGPNYAPLQDDMDDMQVDEGLEDNRAAIDVDNALATARETRQSSRFRATVEDVSDDEEDDGDSSSSDSGSDSSSSPGSDTSSLEEEDEEIDLLMEFEDELSDEDIAMLRAFTLKTEDHLSERTYERMGYAFPERKLPSIKVSKSRLRFLSAFNPVLYDCCINSCCCYTGHLDAENSCPHCKEPRYNDKGKPRKRFMYIPIIPRLINFFKNADLASKMAYRHSFKHDPDVTKDIYDGNNYRRLRNTPVNIGGQKQRYKFFDDPHDIALGLSTDGFAPFKKRKHTAWPLLLFNYNLPPEIRFLLIHILCIGVIPGPKKPKDFDLFLWPLIEELLKLLAGIRAFDAANQFWFVLRAYLIVAFGDMPAMSMVMRMKGINGLFPCRMCRIKGVRAPDGGPTATLYVPLDRSNHPSVQDTDEIQTYDADDLPLRSHAEFMEDARHVQFADSAAEEGRRSTACGIKGIPLLSHLPSLFFPMSFPLDFMHLMYENTIKNLIALWTGEFKGLDEGTGDYEMPKTVWSAIGEATAASGSTIPSAYGARPQNFTLPGISCTADAWSFWSLYLGPILLENRFKRRVYYTHFVELVKLIHLCLQFEISKADIARIRSGFQQWVETYEKLYYQYNPDRLSTCPCTIHSLLHIADGIEACGPVWAYWAFPMERFCGVLLPCIKSRRRPFSNMDSHILSLARLSQIKNRYNAHEQLSLKPEKVEPEGAFSVAQYPDYVLLYPRIPNPVITPGLFTKIVACLSTRYERAPADIRKRLALNHVTAWGKVRRTDAGGGDTMSASSLVKNQEDSRDATFVRYELLVDKNARNRRVEPEFVPKTFYGQLQHIFVVQMPRSRTLGLQKRQTLILAAIQTCDIQRDTDLDMHYYKKQGRVDVVDMNTVQCLVGRVRDRGGWIIIDRSGKLARPTFDLE